MKKDVKVEVKQNHSSSNKFDSDMKELIRLAEQAGQIIRAAEKREQIHELRTLEK